jgi:hypothetical protein
MQGAFIILGGAYADPEICAELGRLPPPFLPVGNSRLYERQLLLAAACDSRAVLSIPQDYIIDPVDCSRLAVSGVRIVRVPLGLSLAQSLSFVLEVVDAQGALRILHGDTLIEGIATERLDVIAAQSSTAFYAWAEVRGQDGRFHLQTSIGDGETERIVAAGYFAFADAELLRRVLSEMDDFIGAVNLYGEDRQLDTLDVANWYDFGHLPLFHRSRCAMLVSRAFNQVTSDGAVVTKSSLDHEKISAEAHWYEALPPALRLYTPQFLGSSETEGRVSYGLEYLHLSPLNEILVFGRLPQFVWRRILEDCRGFLLALGRHLPPAGAVNNAFPSFFFDTMIRNKSATRAAAFLARRGFGASTPCAINGAPLPPLMQIVTELVAMIPPTVAADIRLWHGDFFFGNLFYDFRAARIRTVDPRGHVGTVHSIYGDWRYDVAKFAHSISGGYDLLLANRVDFVRRGPMQFDLSFDETSAQAMLETDLARMELNGRSMLAPEIRALMALLFISALPLHDDDPDRQDRLLASGLRAYAALQEAI